MRKFKPLSTALAVATVLGLVLALSAVPVVANAVTVSIDAPAEADEGSDFTATVDITYVEKFAAAEFVVTFDSTILKVTGVTDGELDGNVIHIDGYTTPWEGDPDKMKVLVSWPPLYPGVDGEGYLAGINFHVIGTSCQTSPIDLSEGKISNDEGLPLEATWQGGSVHVTAPPGPGGGGGGGGGGATPPPPPSPPSLELEVNLWDNVSSAAIDEDGVLAEDVTAASLDGRVTLVIAEGTQVLGPEGDPQVELTVETILDPPDAPEGYHMIVAFDFGPDATTFNPSIEITLQYDQEALPEGVDEVSLVIAYYDGAAGEWMFVTGEVDPAANTVTFSVNHFTLFAIIGAPSFNLSALSISPSTVEPGESVTISIEVSNISGHEGSYTLTLLIDGGEEATQEMTLGPGEGDTATFSVAREIAGTYTVEIAGLRDEFTVIAPFPWALVGGAVGGVLGLLAAVAIAVYLLIFRRRRAAS